MWLYMVLSSAYALKVGIFFHVINLVGHQVKRGYLGSFPSEAIAKIKLISSFCLFTQVVSTSACLLAL